jgi:hypothetical protein
MRKGFPLAALLCLALPAAAPAQCGYGYRTYYPPTYYPPTYYQSHYEEKVVVTEVFKPVFVAVPFTVSAGYPGSYVNFTYGGPVNLNLQQGGPQYNGIAQPAPEKAAEKEIDYDRLFEELEKRAQKKYGGAGLLIPRVSYDGEEAQARVSDRDAVAVLSARCAACHTGASAKGGMRLFLAPGQVNPSVNKAKAVSAAAEFRMPLGAQLDAGKRVPAGEIEILKAWASRRED